jgi:ATP-dependent DNA helicase RecG
MKKDELSKILSLGENQTIEFKSHCRMNSAGPAVCSFLNSPGGYLICGVNDNGEPVGIKEVEKELQKIQRDLNENISPKSLIYVETQKLKGKDVIILEVPAGKDLPYAYRNNIYIRKSDRAQKADINTVRDMIMRRQVEPERWERRFSNANPDEDISTDEVNSTVTDANKACRIIFRDSFNILFRFSRISFQRPLILSIGVT